MTPREAELELAALEAFELEQVDVDAVEAELAAGAEGAMSELELRAVGAELLELLDERDLLGGDELRHAPVDYVAANAELAELERVAAAVAAGGIGWRLSRSCSTRYRAVRTSGRRRLASIELGVVHCTQGSTAAGAAAWFANPRAGGSTQLVVDSAECYRTLPASAIPWGATGVNTIGWHLELAGFAEWSRVEWLRRRRLLERGAYKLAQNGRGRFPMRMLSDRELVDVLRRRPSRRRGLVSHAQVSRVFGGSHWDPGPHFPWDVFLALCRRFERELA